MHTLSLSLQPRFGTRFVLTLPQKGHVNRAEAISRLEDAKALLQKSYCSDQAWLARGIHSYLPEAQDVTVEISPEMKSHPNAFRTAIQWNKGHAQRFEAVTVLREPWQAIKYLNMLAEIILQGIFQKKYISTNRPIKDTPDFCLAV